MAYIYRALYINMHRVFIRTTRLRRRRRHRRPTIQQNLFEMKAEKKFTRANECKNDCSKHNQFIPCMLMFRTHSLW